jgi:hypothetical protein
MIRSYNAGTPSRWLRASVGSLSRGRFHLFSIDIENVVYLRYDDDTGDQYLTVWPPGRESVRRGTSATSVGGPEPRQELLVPD